ncbi:hypothetical protein WJX79_001722 [Trebouxia sp. C0005]
MLTSLITTLRQADSFGLAESNDLAETVLRQGLLAELPLGSAQQHLKWSAAAKEWLHSLLALISDAQTTKCQLACRMAVAAMTASSSSLFVEHYIAYVLKMLELLRKPSQDRATHSQLWPILTAAFNRIAQLMDLHSLRREASNLVPKLIAVLQPIFAAGQVPPSASAYLGSQSPAPQVAAFSRQALLALEGIIHPRAGHTIFPSHRPSASMHPYTSSSTSIDQPTDLGVPKFWALFPKSSCYLSCLLDSL